MASEYEYALIHHQIPGWDKRPPSNEEWFVTDQSAKRGLLKLLQRVRRELQIVWGDCDRDFFNQYDVIEALRSILAGCAAVEIIFSKDVPDLQAAQAEFERFNPRLWGLIGSNRERFKLYWCQRRLQQRYAIADGRDLYLENPKYKPGLTIIKHDEELASRWARRFQAFAEKHGNQL